MTREQAEVLVELIEAIIEEKTDDLQSSDQGLTSAIQRRKVEQKFFSLCREEEKRG